MLNDKIILVTGGTGSFGRGFVEETLKRYKPKKIIVFSRDEYKQYEMSKVYPTHQYPIRYFIGDVCDPIRLHRAFEGVDYVVHAAALKHVPVCEYNPFEAVKTNIYGAENVINAAIDARIKRVIAISTDKAANPANLYGATKLCSDKIFIAGNAYASLRETRFSVVRYGNVSGSRGTVIELFYELAKKGNKELPITDPRMTRFWISISDAVSLVFKALSDSKGGEVYIPKIPSMRIVDLAEAMIPGVNPKIIGIRPGEKLHETLITKNDSLYSYDHGDHFIVYPNLDFFDSGRMHLGGRKVEEGFEYSSENNDTWLSVEEIREHLKNISFDYSETLAKAEEFSISRP